MEGTLGTVKVRRKGVPLWGPLISINHFEWAPRTVHALLVKALCMDGLRDGDKITLWVRELCHRPIRSVKRNFHWAHMKPNPVPFMASDE